jgi:hypothetical protein
MLLFFKKVKKIKDKSRQHTQEKGIVALILNGINVSGNCYCNEETNEDNYRKNVGTREMPSRYMMKVLKLWSGKWRE